jgi:hypothetical protein
MSLNFKFSFQINSVEARQVIVQEQLETPIATVGHHFTSFFFHSLILSFSLFHSTHSLHSQFLNNSSHKALNNISGATSECRFYDCPMGYIITEAITAWASSIPIASDLVFVNGGAIRGSFIEGDINKGVWYCDCIVVGV